MAAAFLSILALGAPSAQAIPPLGAIVDDGTVQMGIQNYGDLTVSGGSLAANCRTPYVSIRQMANNWEGMDCDLEGEGWGVAYNVGLPGQAAPDLGKCWASSGSAASGVSSPAPSIQSFSNDGVTATSVVTCGVVRITQQYTPYPGHPDIYKDDISIKNAGTKTINDLTYRRAMAWGTWQSYNDDTYEDIGLLPVGSLAPPVLKSTGLVSGSTSLDPTTIPTYLIQGPPVSPAVYHYMFDEAMVWNFDFGAFVPGATQPFTLYYGIDPDTETAMATLNAIGAQAYNLAYPMQTPSDGNFHGPIGIMAFGNLPTIPPPPPAGPQADFKPSQNRAGCEAQPVHFTDASRPGDGSIIKWDWAFGDGGGSDVQNPDHLYASSGTYQVDEKVTDDNGMTSTYSLQVTVPPNQVCLEADKPQDNPQVARPPRDGVDDEQASGDADGDRIRNDIDNCPITSNANQTDLDGDEVGDECDNDRDGDLFPNEADSCPDVYNRDQADIDGDGIGDACDPDVDGDTIPDLADNCPRWPNPGQLDSDGDGVGDVCTASFELPRQFDWTPYVPRAAPVAAAAAAPAPASPSAPFWLPLGLAAGAVAAVLLVVRQRRRA